MIKTLTVLAYLLTGAESHQEAMKLSSFGIYPDGEVSVEYTCQGRNVSIPVEWSHVPAGTRSLVLLMSDNSPPRRVYLWAVYNVPPERQWLEPAAKLLRGEHYAKNTLGHLNYDGPCPSEGEHHYTIKLYALRTRFYFNKKVTAEELIQAMQHRVIATATLEAHFERIQEKKHT